ncbi:hypothetical protein CspeluHIS016_0208190 [Cutaneotrichosporon spelunceum]|uniref:AMP binding protein n=1 Tax=Cutaneotrichosporon spelunceum TaxID=1672016 RepID=A0AAD3YB60_9TREE|nr:hypothetical protein CspeluHIS016_0208190 [Cutaneotrichosporon spelunceum]
MVVIYEAPYPAPFFPQQNVFQYLFPEAPGISPIPLFDDSLPAFVDGVTGRTLSRGELRDTALRLGGGMRALAPDTPEVACIWGFNSLEWVVAAYACMAAGVTFSPANAGYTPAELAHQVNDSGASLIFLAPSHLPAFNEAQPLLKRAFPPDRIVLLSETSVSPYKTIYELLGPKIVARRFDRADAGATAWLCYSSGTTGLPKGVMTSHFNITSQIQAGNVGFQRMRPGDMVLGFIPYSHIYGGVIGLLQPISQGAATVVLPRFDEVPVLQAIERFQVTMALFVPPVLIVFLNSPHVKNYDLSSLKTVLCGAAPLSAELVHAFTALIPKCRIIQAYGMTETSPNIANMHRGISVGREYSVGRLLPCYQARLVKENGEDADPSKGEAGELWVRGPSVMKGYHNNPAATDATIAPGGWLKTGDVVTRDAEGWLSVVDRKKELIKYKGFQVAPAEMEGLLIQHENVLDAGVVGVYDPTQATELVRAYLVLAGTDKERTAEDVAAWVAGRAARAKHLSGGIVVVDAIPKSPSGKILRKQLRERAKSEADPVVAMPRAAKL